MSIDLNNVAPKTRKTRAPRKNGETRARTYVYVVRRGKEFLYIGADEGKAKRIEGENPGADTTAYGSRASLPASVLIYLVQTGENLASIHATLGGKMGAASQNSQNRENLLGYIRAAFDTMNKARALQKKDSVELPTINEGEWVNATGAKTLDSDEVDTLNDLADMFD